MRIYLSIPISNLDEKKQRERADKIKIALSKSGYEVVNPFDIIPDKKNPDWFDYICSDLRELDKCDAIFLCNGWKESRGCRLERFYAEDRGKALKFETVETPPQFWER